jgi:hypothetical protein
MENWGTELNAWRANAGHRKERASFRLFYRNFTPVTLEYGVRGSVVVVALRYTPEGSGFDTR